MSSKYINEILLEYEKDRSSAEEQARLNKLELYKKIPRVKAIDTELGTIGLEIAKSIFKKGIDMETLIEKQKQRATDLKAEKAELLSKNNYPVDYGQPKYKCSICQDTGYVGTEKCRCFKQKLIDRYYRQSNLKDILSKENFEMFVFDYYSPHKFEDETLSPRRNMEEIFQACVNFVKNFDTNYENLFFYGRSGLGKTFLSNCIAKDLLDSGRLVIYQTASNLIEILKEARFENSGDSHKDKLDDIFECDLLIIDDLGTEYITDFTQIALFNIINQRLITHKKMIISTNLPLENLYNTYSERIVSRIMGSFTMYKFYGEDIRLKIGQIKRRKAKPRQ